MTVSIHARISNEVGIRREEAAWILERTKYTDHMATAPTSVRPHLVKGDHVSVRLRTGWRLWGFRTGYDRDKFVGQFGGFKYPAEGD